MSSDLSIMVAAGKKNMRCARGVISQFDDTFPRHHFDDATRRNIL